jgi:predicted Zn-dependent protease with MMP-like domain
MDPAGFERIVELAYNSLPQKIRDLPDFPGIQVVDEPPKEMFEKIADRKRWRRGTELLGCYSGLKRTERQFNRQNPPDLIFIFPGPILRCSRGNLAAEVKQVVWHEVAHWLGHDEKEVEDLGLSLPFRDLALEPVDPTKPAVSNDRVITASASEQEAQEQPRCVKCYSTEVSCRESERSLASFGSWLSDPLLVHTKIWTCKSCGHVWADEDDE